MMTAEEIVAATQMTMRIGKPYEPEEYTLHESGRPLYRQAFPVVLSTEGRTVRLTWTKYEMTPSDDITPHVFEVVGGMVKRAEAFATVSKYKLTEGNCAYDRSRARRFKEAADNLRKLLGEALYARVMPQAVSKAA